MTRGQARAGRKAEPPERPGPDQRTLDALAEAVRRAREASAKGGLEGSASPASQARRRGRRSASLGRPGGLPIVLTIVVLLAAAVLALRLAGYPSSSRPSAHTPSRPATTSPAPPASSRPGPSTVSTTTRAPVVTTTAPAVTTTTAPAVTTTTAPAVTTTTTSVAPGDLPQLSSIAPSEGGPGTTVEVRGANFFSPDGLVLARFGGHPAPTDCPTQSSCTVTVPDLPLPPSTLPLTITTEAGTSNALPFRYG